MKIDRHFDLCCCVCGKHRGTDYEMGLWDRKADGLRNMAKEEGWTADTLTGRPICPLCSRMEET